MGNSFVAKIQLNQSTPRNSLVSLDVDPSICINYKSLKKYQEEKGVFTKNDHIIRLNN